MKRIDFSYHNTSENSPVDAIQRTTFTAPIDLVGKLRLTRFKLSQGAFPLCQIPPAPHNFNDAQRRDIDAMGYYPIDIYFAFACSNSNSNGKSLGSSYLFSADGEPTALAYRDSNGCTAPLIFIQQFWVKGEAKWKKVGDNWKLRNENAFLYDFNDLYNSPYYMITYNGSIRVMRVSQENDELKFEIHLQTGVTQGGTRALSNPFLAVSKTFLDVLKLPVRSPFYFTQQPVVQDCPAGATFYPIPVEYTMSPQLQTFLSARAAMPTGVDLDFSVSASIHFPEDISHLFPYTAILLIIDELNNPGQQIVVNNLDSTGVVNLSTLSITKLFLIGQTNYERSDFVFINDSLQESPLLVNLPKQHSLTLRLFFLLKDNSLVPIPLPPKQNFFAELSISD